MSPLTFRLLALALVVFMVLMGAFSLYWLWDDVLPIYGRIYRGTPVVGTPYLAFGLLTVPPVVLIGTIGASIAAWTGKSLTRQKTPSYFVSKHLCFTCASKQ